VQAAVSREVAAAAAAAFPLVKRLDAVRQPFGQDQRTKTAALIA
jgi:hypothetical protein